MFLGTGYYDHIEPLQAEIPGINDFKGTVIHPQFWPTELDYGNKNIVIIGSGATAITILPSVAKSALHVTMLQRSPSYVFSLPVEGTFEKVVRALCPAALANIFIRLKWILASLLMVSFCRRFPSTARRLLLYTTSKQLPKDMALDPNFIPKYSPWDQRMCMCPDGDFFKCLRSGRASVETGEIEAITQNSIRLKSGKELHPDIIVTATGLKLKLAGGIHIKVDGEAFDITRHFIWKASMIEDLPNVVFALGYVDASWTLGADATSQLTCRLLKKMKKEGTAMIVSRRSADEKENMKEVPFLHLNSTYVKLGNAALPKAGDRSQWRPRSYYWKNMAKARWGDVRTGMEWTR